MKGDGNYCDFMEVYKKPIDSNPQGILGVKSGAPKKVIILALERSTFLVNYDVKHLKKLNLLPNPNDEVIERDDAFEINLDL